MSEVKRYIAGDIFDGAEVVYASDFDRVTAEQPALVATPLNYVHDGGNDQRGDPTYAVDGYQSAADGGGEVVRIEYSSLDPVERLAVCRGERQQGKSHIAALLEDLAKQVYHSWESQPGFVPWVDGGNSLKQDEARQIASRTFELALANQVGGDL